MSYQPNNNATLDSTATTPVSASTQFAAINSGSDLGNVTAAALLAWIVSQAQDLTKSTAASALLSSDQVLTLRSGSFVLLPASLFGSAGGSTGGNTSGGSTAATTFAVTLSTASSTVGNAVTMTVTPGSGGWPSGVTVTPTANTVTGTFSPTSATPSGTTAVSFTFTPNAAGSGTLNATATGMTSNGGASYSAMAASGSTTTATAMTFTKPASFATGKFGQGLSAGTGSVQFDVPQSGTSNGTPMANANLDFFFIDTKSAAQDIATPFIRLVDSANNVWGFRRAGTGLNSIHNADTYATGNISDNAFHHIRSNIQSAYSAQNYNDVYTDGSAKQGLDYDSTPCLAPGTATLYVDFDGLAPGVVLDSIRISSNVNDTAVPTSEPVKDSNTLLLLSFNGNGNLA